MSRPAYSPEAFVRRVKMGRRRAYVFYEGVDHDPTFYGQLVEASPFINDVEIFRIETFGGTGGKHGMWQAIDNILAKPQGHEVRRSNGDIARIGFIMDRDCDPELGYSRIHDFILYTHHYDVEAEIFAFSDLAATLMLALHLSPSEGRAVAAKLQTWRLDLARLWELWIAMCCMQRSCEGNSGIGFSRPSVINIDKYGEIDSLLLADAIEQLANAFGAPSEEMEIQLKLRVEELRSTSSDWAVRVLKGKWLPAYLAHRVEKLGYSGKNVRGMPQKVTQLALSTLDFNAEWADRYHEWIFDLVG